MSDVAEKPEHQAVPPVVFSMSPTGTIETSAKLCANHLLRRWFSTLLRSSSVSRRAKAAISPIREPLNDMLPQRAKRSIVARSGSVPGGSTSLKLMKFTPSGSMTLALA